MDRSITSFMVLSVFLLAGNPLSGQELPESEAQGPPVTNWPAPLFWKPAAAARVPGEARTEAIDPVTPLPFIAIPPCRVADTRGNGFSGQYGPPSLVANATRSFTITGQCGVAASAAAVSFNFAALNVGAAGDLRVFPAGGSVPLVSTLNYNANTPNIANAAIVPLGTGGAITVQADATSIDLIIDVNGYYDGNGVITGVSPGTGMMGGGTSGTVTLGIAPGGVTSTELAANSVTSTQIAANAVTAGAIASGQVVKSLNGVTDAATITGSGAVTVNTAGSTVTVGGGTPSGSVLLGPSGDTTITAAGYTELGQANQDIWSATTTTGAPTARANHTAVWTGSKMIVWGGTPLTNTGGQYDPVADSWTATTTTSAPAARGESFTAVWTGSKMIIWGGDDNAGTLFNTGGQYDPVGNSWTATSTTSAPTARNGHSAVWTGTKMVVWGGEDATFTFLDTGGQYDPASDSWTATTLTGAPAGRYQHTAIWTGTRMVVWGGWSGAPTNTGGQYDPVGNSWTATTTTGAPAARYAHTAVWTGSQMIVWGGSPMTDIGGRYDPVGDSWSATTAAGAPSARSNFTAVWNGKRMIIWGGFDGTTRVNTGGRYEPVGDTWLDTTTAGAPAARSLHTAVWTGSKMIIWGGTSPNGASEVNTGGQYGFLSLYVKN